MKDAIKGVKIVLKDVGIIIKEFGISWVINRVLYSLKLKMMSVLPFTERFFEKKVSIKQIDIFELDIKSLQKFLEKLPEEKKQEIIQHADMALEGRILGFSKTIFDYGEEIDWQLNPLTGKSTDSKVKWYRIPDFDIERGDIKVVWEISRFCHLYLFLRAYILTKDEKYYKGFSEQIKNWLDNNAYSYGANFKCGQECTIRMMNILAVYGGFKAYGLVTEEDTTCVKKIVEQSYKKVLSNFFYANKCIKNDHTISELCGMVIGAWCEENQKKIEKYLEQLEKQIQEQFSEDGVYLSYSINYQRYVLQLMEYILKIMPKLNTDVNERTKILLKNAAMFLYQIQNDEGQVPNFGANDGTLIFPVTSCRFGDYRPVVDTVLGLTEHIDIYGVGEYSEEYLWFKNGIEDREKKQRERVSVDYTDAGIYTFRFNENFLMLNAHNYKRRPGQMDQMHIDLWIKGLNVFCDSGTYMYTGEIGKTLASTEGHNTVKVGKYEQLKQMGNFLVYAVPKITILKNNENYIRARFSGKTGYTHTRSLRIKENKLVIKDYVEKKKESSKFKVLFHTTCNIQLINNRVDFYDGETHIGMLESNGEKIRIRKVWGSWFYLDKQEVNLIEIICDDKECITSFTIKE